jgi:periplasmic protein TonB
VYRSSLGARDKGGAIVAVAAIHAVLLFVLLHLSGTIDLPGSQSVLRVFDLNDVPPPPPPPPPQQRAPPKPSRDHGGSAPNIKSQATPVVAPVPRIPPPVPMPVVATQTPAQGTAATQGAAAVAGPGAGSGGQGNGTGTGTGSGSGSGDGGVVSPPRLVTPVLRGRDFPRELLDQWPRGAPVFLRLRIDAQGFISECIVDRGTGVSTIDSEMCNLVHQRLRFRPAVNRSGQAVAGWFGYGQTPPR